MNKRDNMDKLSTGFDELDSVGFFTQGEVTLLTGADGVGKTSFALHVAVGFFCLDATVFTTVAKGLMISADIREDEFAGLMTTERWAYINRTARSIRTAPVYFDERSVADCGELVQNVEELHKRTGVQLVIIDALEYVGRQPVEQMDLLPICSGLAQLAGSLKIAVLALVSEKLLCGGLTMEHLADTYAVASLSKPAVDTSLSKYDRMISMHRLGGGGIVQKTITYSHAVCPL